MRLQTFIYTANPPFSRLAIACATGVLVIIMARAVVTNYNLLGEGKKIARTSARVSGVGCKAKARNQTRSARYGSNLTLSGTIYAD